MESEKNKSSEPAHSRSDTGTARSEPIDHGEARRPTREEVVIRVKTILEENGGALPKHIACRNRLIDIVIGVESGYDMADEILTQYVEMGLIDEEEKAYRLQSIKIHRMQKTFDNLFMYRPKE